MTNQEVAIPGCLYHEMFRCECDTGDPGNTDPCQPYWRAFIPAMEQAKKVKRGRGHQYIVRFDPWGWEYFLFSLDSNLDKWADWASGEAWGEVTPEDTAVYNGACRLIERLKRDGLWRKQQF